MLLKQKLQQSAKGIRHGADGVLLQRVEKSLPFALTHDQDGAWQDIRQDMERDLPMRRLVQGDVGSGKTVIAMLALVKTVENGCQGAMMAPTEILAEQHYESFCRQLQPFGIRISFLSGRLTKKQREAVYQEILRHETDIVIGTHALIQEEVHFHRLGLVVTDEQHRFGVAQRTAWRRKGIASPMYSS